MIFLDMHFSIFFVLYIVILAIIYFLLKKTKRVKKSYSYYAITTFYILLLIKVTMFPIGILLRTENELFYESVGNGVNWYQLIPFKTIIGNFKSDAGMLQFIGNILLVAPIPFIMKYLSGKKYSYKRLLLVPILVSFCIEILQMVIFFATDYVSHAVDIDDIILNSFGAMVTVLVCYIVDKKKCKTDIRCKC